MSKYAVKPYSIIISWLHIIKKGEVSKLPELAVKAICKRTNNQRNVLRQLKPKRI